MKSKDEQLNQMTDSSVKQRHGFSIVELIGTCLLLSILFSMTIPMLTIVARERRSTEQRQFALQHATNLLEQAVQKNWDELAAGELTIPDADPTLTSVLPGLERGLVVTEVPGEIPSRKIDVSIRWLDRTGRLIPPLQLSTWVFPPKEAP